MVIIIIAKAVSVFIASESASFYQAQFHYVSYVREFLCSVLAHLLLATRKLKMI